jgi:hypothetical protein
MTKTSLPHPTALETADYRRPWLYRLQLEAIFHDARYGLVEASTKAGKTAACLVWLAEQAMHGGEGQAFWWVAPGYAQAEIAFRRMKFGLPREYYAANETKLSVSFGNGATVWFKSGEKPDALYGEDVHACVIDEASRVREEAWHAVRSTLTATQGPIRIVGNVKGRKNWFYQLARRAEIGESGMAYAKLIAADAVAAGVLSDEEVEDARRALPRAVFRELYLAEPSDDGGNPFGLAAIAACVVEMSAERALGSAPVCWGWDLAKSRDWTVGIALDAMGTICRIERWQGPWQETIARIREASGDVPALVDATGAGDPVLEALQRGGLGNFAGFTFSGPSKQRLMEGLAVAIQRREVLLPDGLPVGGVVRAELEAFEFEYRRTGVRYAAPEGMHDDCVCALALAWRKSREAPPGAGVLGWMMQRLAAAGRPQRGEQRDEATAARPEEPADLYEAARKKLGLALGFVCARCGRAIGGRRVTDGVWSWHPECR